MSFSWPAWIKRLLGRPAGDAPTWYQFYGQLNSPPPDPRTPLDQINFVVLDVETTGLNPRRDRLVSIGALRVRDRKIILEDALELYLDPPEGHKQTRAIPIHGLLPGSKDRPYVEEETALRQLLDFVGNDILVGHHLGFDLAVLNAALVRLAAPRLRNTVVDTVSLAKKVHPSGYPPRPDQYDLDHLSKRYDIPLSDRHTALGDCYITAILLLKLLHGVEERLERELLLRDLGKG